MYSEGRYFTVTGKHLPGTPTTINERTAELAQLHARVFPATNVVRSKPKADISTDDAALLDKARNAKDGAKFSALYDNGNLSAYDNDDSRADLSLCSLLLFWTQGDIDRADRLFRGSALYRPKWDERRGSETYGRFTLMKALNGKTEFYTPASQRRQRQLVQPRRSGAPKTTDGSTSLDSQLAGFPCTDLGNAERLAARFGENLRFCHLWNRWLIWDNVRWKPDETGQIMRYAMKTARNIYAEVATIPPATPGDSKEDGPSKAATIAAWAKKSESKERLLAMISLAQSLPDIAVHSDAFDNNHWLLNCANGTLDLKTSTLLSHQRTDLITKLSPIVYDPNATAPRFYAFLEKALPDADIRAFLQRAAGYTLTGDTSEQILFFLYGLGKNGKSVFTGVLEAILGDFWTKTRAETIMRKQDKSSIPNDIAALVGRRLVTVSELEANQSLNEALVKDMTGGDRMSTRFMRAEFFTFRPTFKLWLYGNHKPLIRGTNEGIWRRIRLIHFGVTVPVTERDTHLPDKLQAELPGILAWAVRGCLQWQTEGLREPSTVIQATQAYREDMDVLAAFFDECCFLHPRAKVTKAALWAAYEKWCATSGDMAFRTQRALNDALKTRPGISDGTSGHNKAKTWFGIGLNTDREPSSCPSESDPNADCADYADRFFPINTWDFPRKENNREFGSAQSAQSASPLVLVVTETQYQMAEAAARLRKWAHDESRKPDEDAGSHDANFSRDLFGCMAELRIRLWLEEKGITPTAILYEHGRTQQAKAPDMQINGVRVEIKSSRPGYESLAINKKQHDSAQPAPHYYLPALFTDERTMQLCAPIPYHFVTSWPATNTRRPFYHTPRESLKPLYSVEEIRALLTQPKEETAHARQWK